MSYVLHYAPDNASLIVRLVLEEMGQPYETRLVDRAQRAQRSAAYRAVNPLGLIPALETPQGTVFETGAIVLWLVDRHGVLGPDAGAAARGDFLKWLFFLSNTVHAGLRMLFYPEKYVGTDAAAQAALRQQITSQVGPDMTLPQALRQLDAVIGARADARPETGPDARDFYVAVILRWCALYPQNGTDWFDLAQYPALVALAMRLEARASVRAAQRAEGLGPTPFSTPCHATPPEGVAL